jgi:hypothetical protein
VETGGGVAEGGEGGAVKRFSWDRLLWGVVLWDHYDKPLFLGSAWDRSPKAGHADEPSRTLLFNTRASARVWCKERNDKNKLREDCCKHWHFQPVRVREIVKVKP